MLRWLADRALAESITGDLAEERRRRGALWFWRSSLAVIVYFLSQRVRNLAGDLARGLRFDGGREWRQAIRSLRRTPWYALTVIIVIALSSTLATTVFAIVDGVLFKPLPYPKSNELYLVSAPYSFVASATEVRQWAEAVPDARVAMVGRTFTIGATRDDHPALVTGAEVGPGFFETLGVPPLLGGFRTEDFTPSGGRVSALVSYSYWRHRLGGDAHVIGRHLDLAGAVNHLQVPLAGLDVAGVLPRDFVFPSSRATPDIVIPIALTPEQLTERNWAAATALVRVPAGVSPESVRSRIDAVVGTQSFPKLSGDGLDPRLSMSSVPTLLGVLNVSSFRIAFSSALVLVLIAAVNVASLGVARARQRRGELSLRRALGADRWQLIQLVLREVTPLVVAGTTAGLLIAPFLIDAVTGVMGETAWLKIPGVDIRVVMFSGLVALVLVIVAIATAHRAASREQLTESIGRAASATSRTRWSTFSFVSIQVGLTTVLAVAGTLVVGSLWWIWQQPTGFRTDSIVLIEIGNGSGNAAERTTRFAALVDRVRALPAVEDATVLDAPMLQRSYMVVTFKRPPGALASREQVVPVGGEFFPMLGVKAVEGRLPSAPEWNADRSQAVVSESVAHAYWPKQPAVGQILEAGSTSFRVVAVVPDIRFAALTSNFYGQVYYPASGGGVLSSLLVKGRGPTSVTLRAVADVVRSSGPSVGAMRAMSLQAALGTTVRTPTFYAWCFGGFAVAALGIACIGIIGIVTMTSAMRTREMGIRLALGATRDGLVGLLVREQMRLVLAGLLAGGLVAAWAVKYVRQYLYQFTMYDRRLWGIAIATILVAAAAGAFMPSWRASRVDPVKALRVD